MLLLQIRQAEVAVADGRLDEAYQLVQSPSLRSHRRGQALVTELVHKLVSRGLAHLQGSRPVQALADCEKAQQLGGNLDEVLSLRGRIEQSVVEADRARRQQDHAGMLASAAALVDSALGRDDLDRAVAELVRARANGCNDRRLRELDGTVRSTLREQIESALEAGRLDQVSSLMDRLERLDPEGMNTQRLARIVEQAHSAWSAIDSGRVHEAREILTRLSAQCIGAKWIKEALQHVSAAEQSLQQVRTGPLGLLAMDKPVFRHDSPTVVPRPREAANSPLPVAALGRDARVTDGTLPAKFIIQVDGAGSYMVFTKPRVTIGPISSSQMPDVALMAEPGAAVVTVERIEDDYFAAGKLLSSGDRVSVSPRCRLQFSLPNPSSTTATMDLVSGRFPRADLRRVILLDRDLIIGPGASSHIRADQLSQPVVLQLREGRLWHRSQAVHFGAATSVAGASFVVTMG